MTELLFILSMFFACFFQGVAGFGFALIAVPLVVTFLDKNVLISSLVIVGIFLNLILVRKIKFPVNKEIFYQLLFSSMLAMPLGLVVLKLIPINHLRILFGGLSMIFALLICFSRIQFQRSRIATVIIGFIAGFFQTSTTMSGPPIVLYLSGSGMPKDEFRKTLATIFLLMNIASLPIFLFGGALDYKGISLGMISLPFVSVGGILGNKIARLVPQKRFNLMALGTVFIIGLIGIISGLR